MSDEIPSREQPQEMGSARPRPAARPPDPSPDHPSPDPSIVRTALDSSPSALAVFELDGRLSFENAVFRRLADSTNNGAGWDLLDGSGGVLTTGSLREVVRIAMTMRCPEQPSNTGEPGGIGPTCRLRRPSDGREYDVVAVLGNNGPRELPPHPETSSAARPPTTVPIGANGARVFVWMCDITDRLALRASLDTAQAWIEQHERLRNLGELSAGLVHDLHNTLGAIALRIGLLRRDPVCMEAQSRNIEALERIVNEGNALVAKLQGLGRADVGSQLGPVDLRDVIAEAIEIAQSGLKVKAAETGVHVEMETKVPSLPPVFGAPNELTQVFVNLLLNARDAMPTGGKVTIRGEATESGVVVRVEDEGTGIPPATLPHIFDAFFTTKGASGTGLGLAMAKRVMTRIGGNIEAENRSERGAVFRLSFSRTASA